MVFEIAEVNSGWFDVIFKTADQRILISASDAWDNDSPRLFIELLLEIISKKSDCKYVMWDEEPGEYFLCFDRQKDQFRLSIGYSEEAQYMMEKAESFYSNPMGDLSYDQIKNIFDDWEELLVVNNIDILSFAQNVCEEFIKLDINEYEKNWMVYPKEQIDSLWKKVK